MTKNIYTKDGSMFVTSEEDNPMQGIDFCHSCGQDLYLYGSQPCPINKEGHLWIQYGSDVIDFG